MRAVVLLLPSPMAETLFVQVVGQSIPTAGLDISPELVSAENGAREDFRAIVGTKCKAHRFPPGDPEKRLQLAYSGDFTPLLVVTLYQKMQHFGSISLALVDKQRQVRSGWCISE
ncbi:hypothetical protein LZ31DRAFT_285190 [Colletotrichum somersetense]|nr:hypothetical protein LZ31DRAFT_285190 [Colletotrichum somersetense]